MTSIILVVGTIAALSALSTAMFTLVRNAVQLRHTIEEAEDQLRRLNGLPPRIPVWGQTKAEIVEWLNQMVLDDDEDERRRAFDLPPRDLVEVEEP